MRARDPMGEPLTLSLEPHADLQPDELGIEFSQTASRNGMAKGELNWRPAPGQAGKYVLTFAAQKPGGLTVRKSIEITVQARD